jgi:hypothetical protein
MQRAANVFVLLNEQDATAARRDGRGTWNARSAGPHNNNVVLLGHVANGARIPPRATERYADGGEEEYSWCGIRRIGRWAISGGGFLLPNLDRVNQGWPAAG